jgi:hypothetical protein
MGAMSFFHVGRYFNLLAMQIKNFCTQPPYALNTLLFQLLRNITERAQEVCVRSDRSILPHSTVEDRRRG